MLKATDTTGADWCRRCGELHEGPCRPHPDQYDDGVRFAHLTELTEACEDRLARKIVDAMLARVTVAPK